MPANAAAHVRIARPSRDLAAAERFWISGLGLDVLYRHASDGTPDDHSLLMAAGLMRPGTWNSSTIPPHPWSRGRPPRIYW